MVDALAEQARETTFGGLDQPDVGVRSAQQRRPSWSGCRGMVARAPSHASVVAGGEAPGRTGLLFPPTVVAGVEQADELAQSEIFGPVITVQRFS